MTTNELTTVLESFFRNHAEKPFGANEAIAAIAAVIALAALYVAHQARQDSKKSSNAAEKSADAAQRATDLMARQLDLDIKQHTHELEKEVAESLPLLNWLGGSSGGDRFDRQFVNHGGDVQNLEIHTASSGITAHIQPTTSLPHNVGGNITFFGQRTLPMTFTVACQTKLGQRWEKLYKLTRDGIEVA